MDPAPAVFTALDHVHMARALRLAARGAYTTRPNPMVGCVIAHGERIVGEGLHVRAGEPHAEVHALHQAGDAARGATAYVTLEPCAHTGRTGPCADALVEAGISRVVAAMRDPFPKVDGAGFARLRDAGIAVEHGLMAAQARLLNRGWLSLVERGRPWLRVKLAGSLDGHTALPNGESKWITGDAARADVQRWRARAGAVLTGAGTVLADDPALTARVPDEVAPPLRVVLDTRLRTLACSRVREGDAPTLYLHDGEATVPRGIDALAVESDGGRLHLPACLDALAARGINEVHVEAGATLSGALLHTGLVDEVLLYVAPAILGDGRSLFAGLGLPRLADAPRLQWADVRRVGDDLRLLLRA